MPTAAAVREELTSSIRELADLETTHSVKGRLNVIARRIGLPFGRVRKYWYGEIACPPAHEADQIRAYYKAAEELIEARRQYEKRRSELLETGSFFARFAPPPLRDTALSNEAELSSKSPLAKDTR